jgi:hypothetical protein
MTNQLVLTGTNNTIDVGNGGTLRLHQTMTAPPMVESVGGIVLGAAHNNPLAVYVDAGGELDRDSTPFPGVPDRVRIGGAIYNVGGTVSLSQGEMLHIANQDSNNYSYWQKTGVNAKLLLAKGANIQADGSYQIDRGTVQFTAPSGAAADELDGVGLNFGNDNNTFLTIVDSTPGTPGTVSITGTVTLAAKTTTTLNYNGTTNKADLLDIGFNGPFTLNGTLNLQSGGTGKPTGPLDFLAVDGDLPVFAGAFTSIIGDIAGAQYTSRVDGSHTGTDYFEVTIQ